jgi:hypothetical protein
MTATGPPPLALSSYELIEELPTDQGRSVHVARAPTGERVLVKQAYDENWARDLREQTSHFLTLRELLGDRAPYPDVVLHGERLLVMRFYPYGSLDDLSHGQDRKVVADLTAAAVHQLFEISAAGAPGLGEDAQRADAAASFLVAQAEKRVDRLRRALGRTTWGGQPHEGGRTRGEVLDEALAWISTGALAAHAARLGPPKLALAAHGDFGMNNIMLADPPSSRARLVFIDTRGIWMRGLPWWDPIMDLATLLAFHCRIEPAFAAAGGRTSPEVLSAKGRLQEAEIMDLVTGDDAARAWMAGDPGWRERLEVEIAIRLLGSVSVQLLTAHSNGEARAAAVLDLYLKHARRVSRMLSASA